MSTIHERAPQQCAPNVPRQPVVKVYAKRNVYHVPLGLAGYRDEPTQPPDAQQGVPRLRGLHFPNCVGVYWGVEVGSLG